MAEQQDITIPEVAVENKELYMALDVEEYQIRILTILPDPRDSLLRCLLTTTSLLHPKPYTALSYCWGDPDIKATILVNESNFEATLNLSYALCQLRARGIYDVWADAICINQEDRQERSLQVRLMRQIFSKAIKVVACVGTDSENREAISILSQPICLFIGKHHHKGPLISRLRKKGSKHYPGLDYLEDFKARAQGSQGRERKILDRFFALPYWRRVWVIQEIAVAPTVEIVCGHEWISWEFLAGSDAFYQESESDEWSYVRKMIVFREEYRLGARHSLLSAMDQTHDALSTDPRDKIFALLGLCHDGEQLVPYPNYKQSVYAILRDLTRNVISAEKCLDYIFLPRLRTQKTHEPSSWTISWLTLRGRATSNFFKPKCDFKILGATNPNVLKVHGTIIDTIEPFTNLPCNMELQKFNAMHNASAKYYQTSTNLADAFWASLSLDLDGFSDQKRRIRSFFFSRLWTEDGMCQLRPNMHVKILETCRKGVISSGAAEIPLRLWRVAPRTDYNKMNREERRHFERSFTDWIEDLGTWNIHGEELWKFQRFAREQRSTESDIDVVLKNLFKVFHNQMKLIATFGGLIGIAHAHVKSGDRLCYVAGCSYPVVLRPAKSDGQAVYHLVGAARMRFTNEDSRRKWNQLEKSEIFEII